MPYRFLEDIAIADVAFEATGADLEEVFIAAADALMNVMVADRNTIRTVEEVEFQLDNGALDMLLFDFLNEIIFLKDARRLLLRVMSLEITERSSQFVLKAKVGGEQPDSERHPLIVDVKAVTLHRFKLENTGKEWRAEVVLDI